MSGTAGRWHRECGSWRGLVARHGEQNCKCTAKEIASGAQAPRAGMIPCRVGCGHRHGQIYGTTWRGVGKSDTGSGRHRFAAYKHKLRTCAPRTGARVSNAPYFGKSLTGTDCGSIRDGHVRDIRGIIRTVGSLVERRYRERGAGWRWSAGWRCGISGCWRLRCDRWNRRRWGYAYTRCC